MSDALDETKSMDPIALSAPAGRGDRLVAIDVVRGVAVLGILAMNIISIGLPGAARLNPEIWGGFEALNRWLWWLGYLLFDEKMIALFSMLFGAGLVLQADRATARGGSPARLFYRRVAILLVIGLIHAYLIWDGDILVTYALCGMIVYPLRRLPPRWLIAAGLLVMLPSIPFGLLISSVFENARAAAEKVDRMKSEGVEPSPEEIEQTGTWKSIRRSFQPERADTLKQIEQARSEGYWEHVQKKASEAFAVQTQLFVGAFVWLVSGRMLIGMGLMKLGVFSGTRTRGFSLRLAMIGYGLGLPLVALCARGLIRAHFSPIAIFGGGLLANSFAGLFVALGHVGLVVWLFQSGRLTWLTTRLAAAGRMALTNYLTQSLVCTTLFCGWGFGLIGALDRSQLYALMLLIWSIQLWYSRLWLKRYAFGPAEWLWRTLTYGKIQPVKIRTRE